MSAYISADERPRWIDGASATSSAVVATSQDIIGVSVSPAMPHAGDTAVVTVTGSPTCGAVGIDYGDGTVIVYAIDGLPISQYHSWTTGGPKTVIATGHGGCVGQVSTAVTVNAKPVVTLTSPAIGSTYAAPASVSLSASASDSDGGITQVVFTANGTVLATRTTPPHSYTWTNVAAGSYTITATGTDTAGATTSASAAITVSHSGPSTVTSVVAPATASVGQWITATAYGTNPCGMVQFL